MQLSFAPPTGGTKQGSPPLRNHLLEAALAPARPTAPLPQQQPVGGGGGGGTTPAPITMQGGHCGTTPAPLRPQYGWGGTLPPASAGGHMAATPASNILRPMAPASASGAAAVSAGGGGIQGGRGQALRLTSGQYKIPGGWGVRMWRERREGGVGEEGSVGREARPRVSGGIPAAGGVQSPASHWRTIHGTVFTSMCELFWVWAHLPPPIASAGSHTPRCVHICTPPSSSPQAPASPSRAPSRRCSPPSRVVGPQTPSRTPSSSSSSLSG